MTKQELLDKYIPCQCWPAKDGEKTYNVSCPQHSQDPETAMDEWAEIEAVSFAEWVEDNACCRDGVWYIFGDYKENRWGEVDEDCKKYTTAQLFQLFKTQQTKTS